MEKDISIIVFSIFSSTLSLIIGLSGVVLAAIFSYKSNKSIPWAIVHGFFSWFYVIYYFIFKRSQEPSQDNYSEEPLPVKKPEEPSINKDLEEPLPVKKPEEPSINKDLKEPLPVKKPEEPSQEKPSKESSEDKDPEEPLEK